MSRASAPPLAGQIPRPREVSGRGSCLSRPGTAGLSACQVADRPAQKAEAVDVARSRARSLWAAWAWACASAVLQLAQDPVAQLRNLEKASEPADPGCDLGGVGETECIGHNGIDRLGTSSCRLQVTKVQHAGQVITCCPVLDAGDHQDMMIGGAGRRSHHQCRGIDDGVIGDNLRPGVPAICPRPGRARRATLQGPRRCGCRKACASQATWSVWAASALAMAAVSATRWSLPGGSCSEA